MRGIPLCLLVLLLFLAFALHAMAGNWGENWGTMIWEQSAPVVPSMKGVGLSVLLLSLGVATTSPQSVHEPAAGGIGCAPDRWGDGSAQLEQWGDG